MSNRVLVGTDVMVRGGVDTYTTSLVRRALDKGWNVEIVIDPMSHSTIAQDLSGLCPIHQCSVYHRLHDASTIETAYSSLLKKGNFKFVHLSCGTPWACLTLRERTLQMAVPLLFTEHYVPSDLTLEPEIASRLIAIYGNAQAIIHISYENVQNLGAYLSSSLTYPLHIIPNGIDWRLIQKKSISAFQRLQRLRIRIAQSEKLKILVASRLTKQKGIDILIEAVQGLTKEDTQRFELHIYGEGSELSTIQKIVNVSNLDSTVKFYPWTSALIDLFARYDFFISPSRYEGLPFTLLEALSSGIPILTSAIPVHQWITRNGKYALLFPSEDTKALRRLLKNWLKDPVQVSQELLCEDLDHWIDTYFNEKTNLDKTLDVWNSLIHEEL